MLEVYRAAADLQDRCRASGWRFCVIGGLALQRWGEPRETIDVDVTLLTGFGRNRRSSRTWPGFVSGRASRTTASELKRRSKWPRGRRNGAETRQQSICQRVVRCEEPPVAGPGRGGVVEETPWEIAPRHARIGVTTLPWTSVRR